MSSLQSSADLRFWVVPQAILNDNENPNDLQNINVAKLPNGAFAYVVSQRAAYTLDKFSDATADGAQAFAPAGGGGRWLLFGASSGGAPPVMLVNTEGNSNAFAVTGDFVQSSGSSFTANEGQELARWTLTAAGGILTWNGPSLPMLVMLTAAIEVGNADAARTVTGFVSLNDESPSPTNGGTQGKTSVVFNHANASQTLATTRFITAVSNGSTFRVKLAGPAAATSLLMTSTQLILMPL